MRFLSILCLLLLTGCAGPKVLFHVENDAFTADFYDTACSSSKVLALTGPAADGVKDGHAEFKNGPKLDFCYVAEDDLAFVIDEEGDQGFVELKK